MEHQDAPGQGGREAVADGLDRDHLDDLVAGQHIQRGGRPRGRGGPVEHLVQHVEEVKREAEIVRHSSPVFQLQEDGEIVGEGFRIFVDKKRNDGLLRQPRENEEAPDVALDKNMRGEGKLFHGHDIFFLTVLQQSQYLYRLPSVPTFLRSDHGLLLGIHC